MMAVAVEAVSSVGWSSGKILRRVIGICEVGVGVDDDSGAGVVSI